MEYTRFAFTLSKPSAHSLARLHSLPGVKFLIYSRELTPNTRLFHHQGYLEMLDPIHPFKLKYLLGGAFYVEPAKESKETNCKYCLKCGNPFYIKQHNDSIKSYAFQNTLEIFDKYIKDQ